MVEEVDKLWAVVTEKYKGFLNFWKPYRFLDSEFNRRIEDLEKAVDYESKKMKTGGNKAKQIAGYIGNEMLSDVVLSVCLGISLFTTTLIINSDVNSSFPLFLKGGCFTAYFGTGSFAKYHLMPQIKNRELKKKDYQKMKASAKFIQSIIEEVVQKN